MSTAITNGIHLFGSEHDATPMSNTDVLNIPIVRALAVASAAGIPTIAPLHIAKRAANTADNQAALGKWLESLLLTDPVWERLDARVPLAVSTLAPVALVHLHDGILSNASFVVPLTSCSGLPFRDALRDSVLEHFSDRLVILEDLEPDAVLEMVIQPGHSTWLQLGAILYFAKFSVGGRYSLSELQATASDGIKFRMANSPTADAMAQRLASLWPCAFHAVFAEVEGVIQLVDLSIDEQSEQENSRHIFQLVQEANPPSECLDLLIANAAVYIPSTYRPTRPPIAHGQSQGDRCISGPMACTLKEAARFAGEGQRPVLVVSSLLPSEAYGLERCGALVLGQAGLATHIAILARSLGLAVVTRVDGLWARSDASVSLGNVELKAGDVISVREEDGGVYLGAIPVSDSSATEIAAWIEARGDNPVAIAIGARSENLPTRRVGLCRSEMQIVGSSDTLAFQAFLVQAATLKQQVLVPEEVQTRLRNCLAELLINSRGELTNYRLIDADLGELLGVGGSALVEQIGEIGALPGGYTTIRGPRWALASGFYDWQLGMAISTAAAAACRGPINLLITLPSAFSLEEVRAVRDLFDRHLLEHPGVQSSVRFGVMLETPRLCATPSSLATSAHAFCFGLNDLTSAAFGLTREVWPALAPYYSAAGLRAQDPFASLDLIGVGALVGRTIRKLREAGAQGPILLCGEPAASEVAHNRFAREQGLYFSVGESDWAKATLSCARVKARIKGSVGFEHSPANEQTVAALRQVIAARRNAQESLAQEAALRWFMSICRMQPFPNTRNWKVLKKALVASIFGAPEGRFFPATWSTAEVVHYVRSLDYHDRTIRISAFPNDISCHARSEVVGSNWLGPDLYAFVQSFDPDTTLNVFPQQHADQMCFRLVYSKTALALEAGWGQAMYVFETERGLHPIISCQGATAEDLADFEIGASEQLSSAFSLFLESGREWIQAMHDTLPPLIGAEQLAIEGYFDPITGRRRIVDMDIPLDIAWNTTAK